MQSERHTPGSSSHFGGQGLGAFGASPLRTYTSPAMQVTAPPTSSTHLAGGRTPVEATPVQRGATTPPPTHSTWSFAAGATYNSPLVTATTTSNSSAITSGTPPIGSTLSLPNASLISPSPVQGMVAVDKAHVGASSSGCWVTVFGFAIEDNALVLAEMEKCGEIVNWKHSQSGSNYVHIQYHSPSDAHRALSKNGQQLSNRLIVGVKPMEECHRKQLLSAGSDTMMEDTLAYNSQVTKFNYSKPAQNVRTGSTPGSAHRSRLQASSNQLPQPVRSTWSKVTEFVFGL